MITVQIMKGRASPIIHPNLAINRRARQRIEDVLSRFPGLLPDGMHTLEAFADELTADAPEDSPLILNRYASFLRDYVALYAPTNLATPGFVTHAENLSGRDFVVSDIHGQFKTLQDALSEVNFDRKVDRLFSVGDLIDRGARSFDCLSLAFEDFFKGTLGNHEWLALNALAPKATQRAWDNWQANGGDWVLGENAKEVAILIREAVKYLPLGREVTVAGKKVGICHAEPPMNWNHLRDSPELLVEPTTWGRNRIRTMDRSPVEGIDLVIVGHTIVQEPLLLGNVLYIDTGACRLNGKLTLLDLSTLVKNL